MVWDTIWRPDDGDTAPLEQWGGIAYSLSALSAAVPADWSIVPIIRVGADLAAAAEGLFRTLPRVNSSVGVRVIPERNNRVQLRYLDRHSPEPGMPDRTETLTGGVSAWPPDELLPLVGDLDALFINFISGFEISLDTAENLRRNAAIPIYADLHSLFLGSTSETPRRPRPLPEWERWVAAFDAVQVNEAEMALIGETGKDVVEDPLIAMVRAGAALAVETRGGAGAGFAAAMNRFPAQEWVATRETPQAVGQVSSGVVALPGRARAGDPTGCGDVWGAVLFAGLLEGMSLVAAIERAHEAAMAKIRTRRITELRGAVAGAVRKRVRR